jgi:hypothetical protein
MGFGGELFTDCGLASKFRVDEEYHTVLFEGKSI